MSDCGVLLGVIALSQSANKLNIELSEDMTVQAISIVYEIIVESSRINSNLNLEIGQGVVVDLTLVQLLETARRSARAAGGGLTLSAPAAGGLLDILHRGGFLQTADQRAFWLLETGDI